MNVIQPSRNPRDPNIKVTSRIRTRNRVKSESNSRSKCRRKSNGKSQSKRKSNISFGQKQPQKSI